MINSRAIIRRQRDIMINNMDMDKDLSPFGEGTYSIGKTSLFFPAAGEKKINNFHGNSPFHCYQAHLDCELVVGSIAHSLSPRQ